MNMPTWQRELENFIGIKPLFVLEGNVSDLYPWDCEGQTQFLPLAHILPELFAAPDGTRPYRFLYVDPLRGVHDPLGTGEVRALAQAAQREAERLTAEAEALNPGADPASRQQPFAANRLVHDSLLVRAALSRRLGEEEPRSVACVFDFASRLASSPEDLTPEENAVFMNLLLGAKDAIRGDGEHVNTLVLVANKATDLPSWLVRGNPDVRVIALPSPDRPAREAYLDIAFPDLAAPELDRPREKLVDTTDRMLLTELDELRRLYARGGTAPEHVTELVDLYKYGIRENRWSAMMDKLRDDPAAALRRRVKGQEPAIAKIVSVLKRSVLGFSGMQHSSGTKPKGVLFLAGPTGTGKTEIVKAVTELLFGDERSYLRFDMSEYAADASDQKLFGAPPGYVGYEAGGQLTNAVRANPFSVLLFDEVEKAHPSIMDKFLQILEDGRMTDGQGQTVYFGETLIFFTSNVGISEELLDEHGRTIGRRNIVQPGEPYDVICARVQQAMATHFKPEVLNRIGDNIVVFDYISPEASRLILESQIRKINGNVRNRCGITVAAAQATLDLLAERALAPEVRENGGRGIGNLVEDAYLNPLSTFIFDENVEAGEAVEAVASAGAVTFRRADEGAGATGWLLARTSRGSRGRTWHPPSWTPLPRSWTSTPPPPSSPVPTFPSKATETAPSPCTPPTSSEPAARARSSPPPMRRAAPSSLRSPTSPTPRATASHAGPCSATCGASWPNTPSVRSTSARRTSCPCTPRARSATRCRGSASPPTMWSSCPCATTPSPATAPPSKSCATGSFHRPPARLRTCTTRALCTAT